MNHRALRLIRRSLRSVSLLGAAPVLATVFALVLSGCPREPDAPDPLMGTPCDQMSTCNPGISCGAMKLCVDGYCEEGASLLRPCRDEGVPVVPPER